VSPSFGFYKPIHGRIGSCHVEIRTVYIVTWQGDVAVHTMTWKGDVLVHIVMWQVDVAIEMVICIDDVESVQTRGFL
jgi:hypothetical protein